MKLIGSLSLVLLLHSATLPAAEVDIPPAGQLFKTLRSGHPRLLACPEDWVALKARIQTNPQPQGWSNAIRKDGEKLLNAAPSKYEIPDGKRLLATSRRVLDRMQILGLLWQLDHDQRWADRAWIELEAAAQFKDWNPSHFLDTAEMTHAFAIGYDWLYDAWTPEQRETLQHAMVKKGIQPAMKIYGENGWWVRAHHNWNQVCNGGIGMGALALAEVEPELSAHALHAGLKSIQIAMNEFAPDGACIEGPGYWGYATSYNFVFLAALESALGTDFGLAEFPGVAETGWYPVYMSGPTGRTFNYADSRDGRIRAPQLLWLAARFQEPALAAFELNEVDPKPLDLVWYRPLSDATNPLPPLGRYFRDSEAVTLRGSWTDPETTFVGFKAGKNNANHGHLDIGSFVLDSLGERWAVDLAGDNYNLPAYFGNQRWNYYRLRAEGQNTLVINPDKGPDQVLTATPITRFELHPDRSFAIGDLTAAYAPAVRSLQRGVRLIKGRDVLIQDELKTDAPVDLWWFMHTKARIATDPGQAQATLSLGGKEMEVRILEPARAAFTVMPAQPLPSSPHPDRQAANKDFQKLGIHLPETTDVRLAVLFSPVTPEARKNNSVEIHHLEQW